MMRSKIYSRLWRMHDWSRDLRKRAESILLGMRFLIRVSYKRSPSAPSQTGKKNSIHHLHEIDWLFPLFVSLKDHFGNFVEFMVVLLMKNEGNSQTLECCNLFCRKLQFFSVIFCDPNGLKSLGFVRHYRKIHQGSFLDRKYLSVRRENSEHFDTSKHEV